MAKSEILKDNISFLAIALATILICNVVLVFHIVPTGSMEPTIRANSLAVCLRFPYLKAPKPVTYGSIVSYQTGPDMFYIKRVIGLPGDTITFIDGHVYRNGEMLTETYLMTDANTDPGLQKSYTVPEGCFFAMGDNREHSKDSRYLENPYIDINRIHARLLFSIPLP